jgi:pyridoxamine 5'-phosphate oxidase
MGNLQDQLYSLRSDYSGEPLDAQTVAPDPFIQFEKWMAAAIQSKLPDANAFSLASVHDGKPSLRVVLLRGIEEGAFVFYTNYNSRKGQELIKHPHAAMCFFWPELMRQIRIEGRVERVAETVSDAYFASRPRESQLGAWASPQSETMSSRDELDSILKEVTEKYEGQAIPRPPHWGGFSIAPESFEFWQGRNSRLHDRIRYVKSQNDWQISRLAP